MSVSEYALTDGIARIVVDQLAGLQALVSTLVALLVGSIQAVAFWVAALLPLTYLPLLATGVAAEHPLGFVALLGANGVAFVIGHAHNRGEHAHAA